MLQWSGVLRSGATFEKAINVGKDYAFLECVWRGRGLERWGYLLIRLKEWSNRRRLEGSAILRYAAPLTFNIRGLRVEPLASVAH